MPKQKFIGLLWVILGLVFPSHGPAQSTTQPGLIWISPPGSRLKMPQVPFPHDRHSQSMEGKCSKCHFSHRGKPIFQFRQLENTPDSRIKNRQDFFHKNCMGCHREHATQFSPPLEAQCRRCHNEKIPQTTRSHINFNRSLHHFHETRLSTEPGKKNCHLCHHTANPKTREIFYEAGTESACIYCHEKTNENGIRNARRASHDTCVSCHLSARNARVPSGPVDCGTCHGPLPPHVKAKNLPRYQRNQPDTVLIKGWPPLGQNKQKNKTLLNRAMDAVPFDHKFHETQQIQCKTCHHENLKPCTTCHTLAGTPAGQEIPLETAMHHPRSPHSCQGCHNQVKETSPCKGCHQALPKTAQNCIICHNFKAKTLPQAILKTPHLTAPLVRSQIAQREVSYIRMPQNKIPKMVTIDALAAVAANGDTSSEYHPSHFPHGKVVNRLLALAGTSPLAKAFHAKELNVCTGCHHHSPPSPPPPPRAS
ncbi:MAG: hypothetical protein MI749_05730, partial [Desulfovibrionales bacterium]|nr:hypothetical protein [Desulfovibrionales bacterium]